MGRGLQCLCSLLVYSVCPQPGGQISLWGYPCFQYWDYKHMTPPVTFSQGFWGLNSRPRSNWPRSLPNSAVPSAIKSLCHPDARPGRAISGKDEPAAFSKSWGILHFLPWVSSLSLLAVVVIPGSPGSLRALRKNQFDVCCHLVKEV